MIEVFCRNRLGNVLFLYAVGRQLAVKNNTRLRMHLAHKNGQDKAILHQLSYFNLQAEVLTIGSGGYIEPPDLSEPFSGKNVFVETEWGFNPKVLMLKDGARLDGNFQCEKYFTDIKQLILQELQISDDILDQEASGYLRKIQNSVSVGLHVRRGDYMNLELHNVCDRGFYTNAIEHMNAHLVNPNYFVFSDEIGWCKENFGFPNCTFVDLPNSRSNPVLDFKLMSLCCHNIIANSTFSWWPAWLNSNKNKIVVGPQRWFHDEERLEWVICQDTIPDDWVRVDC